MKKDIFLHITEKLTQIGFYAAILLIIVSIISIVLIFQNWAKEMASAEYKHSFYQDKIDEGYVLLLFKRAIYVIIAIILLYTFW